MIGFLARRLVRSIVIVWVAISGVFLMSMVVGDPAVAMLGPQAQPAQLEAFRARHGLDRPWQEQYLDYSVGLVVGDLGTSYRDDRPVTEVLATRLPRTMLLGGMALFFEVLFGLTIGVIAALNRNRWLDGLVMSLAFLGISAPTFLTGLLALQIVAFRMGLAPVGGYGIDALDHVRHAVLPALTIAILGAATYARIMRSEMIETLRADYVRTARAKGLERLGVIRHAFRNALLPIVTMVGLSMPILVSGALVTETVYAWPGMGRLAIESIYSGDLPMVLGVVLVAAVAVQLGTLGADLAVALLDPRVRLQSGSR